MKPIKTITTFTLDDFAQWLTDDEKQLLQTDGYERHKLEDIFIEGLNWTEAAREAVSAWRESRATR